MKVLNFNILIETVSTRSDIYMKFDSSKGIQDQKSLTNFLKLGHIPATSLRGWIRHGMEKLLLSHGISVCHPLPKNTITSDQNKQNFIADQELGYHPRGECKKGGKEGCLIFHLFGDLNEPGKIIIPPVFFYPAKSSKFKNLEKVFGIGTGRVEITRNSPRVRSRNGMYMTTEITTGVYIEAPFKIILRDGAEKYYPVVIKTLEFLYKRVISYDFTHLLGGFRSFGHGRAVVVCLSGSGNYLTKSRKIGIEMNEFEEIEKKFDDIIKHERDKFPIGGIIQ
ncbi:MAG: RAMP superfamily CRISPR-associated protein [Candidatus Helarchaeota archaeon]